MSQQDDTPRLDRQEDRMEDQERRLENGEPPRGVRSTAPGGSAPAITPSLDAQADRMEDQERRLENDQPPRSLGDRT